MATFADVPDGGLFLYDGETFRKTKDVSDDGQCGFAWSVRNSRKHKLWGFHMDDQVEVVL